MKKDLDEKNYELWEICEIDGQVLPLFLIERGDYEQISKLFMERKNSIITNKSGEILESHYKYKINI